ncbi:hypothetical protein BGW80DRAFT_1306658 [Lactifluus volemus]|nr:hypothetical protein BGW80DRAFT_1306658 [Lactifluus volemus]
MGPHPTCTVYNKYLSLFLFAPYSSNFHQLSHLIVTYSTEFTMKFLSTFASFTVFALAVSANPIVAIEAIAPPIGFTAGKNPTGTGDCDGAVNGADGKPIKVPCSCPPDQATFNEVGGPRCEQPIHTVEYPLDNSPNSQLNRVDTAIITMQNLFGPGKGCPAASTTFSAQRDALLKQLGQ